MWRHISPSKILTLTVLLLVSVAALPEDCESGNGVCLDTTPAEFDQDKDWNRANTIYEFYAKDIQGNNLSLRRYRGHVCIIVNVASQCGLTDTNYKELVQLYEEYSKDKGLRILAFPSNQFGGQEPGSSEQILDFVKKYNVTFDVFEKVNVNGDDAHPLWKWLKTQAGGLITDSIKWNFTKFIINKEGKVVSRYSPYQSPLEMETELKKYF